MCGASAWPLCMACGLRGRKGCVVDGPSRMPVPRMLATQRVCLSDVKIGPCLFCILASCNKGNGQGWVRREACMRRHSQGFCSAAEGDRVSALLPWTALAARRPSGRAANALCSALTRSAGTGLSPGPLRCPRRGVRGRLPSGQ